MPRFEILASGIVIGHSELERGDAPMGVADGKFLPSPNYAKIKPAVVAATRCPQEHLSLTARLVGGDVLPAVGVHITDYSADLGDDGLEVSVFGVGYPLYGELFPEHVAAYDARFRED